MSRGRRDDGSHARAGSEGRQGAGGAHPRPHPGADQGRRAAHRQGGRGAGGAPVRGRRLPAGGRPAKLYEIMPAHVERGTTLVADMLATLIEHTGYESGPARQVAFDTGERLGRRYRPTSETPTFDEQAFALVRALSEVSGATRIAGR